MKRSSLYFSLALACLFLSFQPSLRAQFKDKAFRQDYSNPADSTAKDSADVVFSFKDYFGGLAHKHESKVGVVFAGSTVFIGGAQIYNGQYWKLPVLYGGLAATAGCGFYYRHKWKETGDRHYQHLGNWCLVGTGLVYWAALLDGAACYKADKEPHPGRSTLYSLLLPGLGQAYNGEYWKIPVYYTGLLASAHFFATNNTNYRRYKRIHNEATSGAEYDGPITADRALYYRNLFRRYRDYSVVALAGFYLLQVIDANVFAYMQDFDVTDDISLNVGPAVIGGGPWPENYALNALPPPAAGPGISGVGLRLGFTF